MTLWFGTEIQIQGQKLLDCSAIRSERWYTCCNESPFSIESGTKNGITLVAITSLVRPNLLLFIVNL